MWVLSINESTLSYNQLASQISISELINALTCALHVVKTMGKYLSVRSLTITK